MDVTSPDFIVMALCRFSQVNFSDHINKSTLSPDLIDITIKINNTTMIVRCIVSKRQGFKGSMLEHHYEPPEKSVIEYGSFKVLEHHFITDDDVIDGSTVITQQRLIDAHRNEYYKQYK